MTPRFSEALASLEPQRQGGTTMARCPAHEDRVRSLSIREDGGKVLLRCHAGCDTRDIVGALGLTMADLFDEPLDGPIEDAVYDYRAADGTLLSQVVRYRPKAFRQRRPDGAGGWIWDLEGVERVPYRLPQILDAREVIVVEGEKDVERLVARGLEATCNMGGSGGWRPEWAPMFKGKTVTIIPDNDDSGRKHAEAIRASLAEHARRVRVVELPDLPPKGDVSDYLDSHSFDELLALIRPSIAPTIDAYIRANAETRRNDLYDRMIPSGGLVMFVGQPRSFKTMGALQLMFSVAGGDPWLSRRPSDVGSALYVSEEGAKDKVAERLYVLTRNYRIDNPIHILHREGVTLTGTYWEKVSRTLDEMDGPRVVILDTLAALMEGDENSVQDIRQALRPIQKIITDYGVTVILVHHVNKGGEGRMGHRMRGSSALWGACDGVLGFTRNIDDFKIPLPSGKIEVETKDNDPFTLDFEFRADEMSLIEIPKVILPVKAEIEMQRSIDAAPQEAVWS